jgi:hypothetical protein
MGKDALQIAALFISLATVSVLIVHAQGTATVANAIGHAFGGVLGTATFQNGYGNTLTPY